MAKIKENHLRWVPRKEIRNKASDGTKVLSKDEKIDISHPNKHTENNQIIKYVVRSSSFYSTFVRFGLGFQFYSRIQS